MKEKGDEPQTHTDGEHKHTDTRRHTVGGNQISGYSAGWRLCLTDRPSYINLTDAGSGSNKASWPHTGMHSHKEADARTHRDRFYSHSAFMRHMVESLEASKHTHTHLHATSVIGQGVLKL